MKLYLQTGYGMMKLSRLLVSKWNGGTVILSPRDLKQEQLPQHAKALKKLPNGEVLVDPQFYLPHSDHDGLVSHDFWPNSYSTGGFFGGPALATLITEIKKMNQALGTSMAILPGLLATQVDDDWIATQDTILAAARSANFDQPLCQTIALSADACRFEIQVSKLLEHVQSVGADAYYLVCEHPLNSYLVSDPTWLANVVDIIAGLKLTKAPVIVGYANHQMLIAAIAKADAIASGTWLNVRSFSRNKFQNSDDTKRKATWYYAPRTLSEYKLPFLDIARTLGLLNYLEPTTVRLPFINALFSGGQPSAIGLSEPHAFQHYLETLQDQVSQSVKASFDETVEAHLSLLEEAAGVLSTIRPHGINGQDRDFWDSINANRAAISAINATRGPLLRHLWNTL